MSKQKKFESALGNMLDTKPIKNAYRDIRNNKSNEPINPTNPINYTNQTGVHNPAYFNKGLTKREYFAGLAMQAIIADSYNYETTPEIIANTSVVYADALLNELSKTEEP